ncbi:MAG: hypothetical protein AMJ64_08510 [Betaproteobacteria bacterium SG8_39]|nr:MAG: hypothetical protein AMJ64_08510 [Betaproteobacteria bacterium SG8_39]
MAFVLALLRRVGQARAARDWLHVHGALAEGEVLRVWQENHGGYCVRYRFTPQGAREPIQRDEFAGCLAATVPEAGAKVRVRYDPESPERSLLAREA